MASKQLIDPITRQVYVCTPDGLVEVTDPATGAQGIFAETGEWRSGELRYANRQLLGWMGRLSVRLATQATDSNTPSVSS